MVMDKNPAFGRDDSFRSSAHKAAQVLWDATNGNPKAIPQSYLASLQHEYSDGGVSLLPLLNKVSLEEGTYEEYAEVVDRLIHTYSEDWPASDSILEIQSEKLLQSDESDFDVDFSEWDFAEPQDMSDKVELFLKKVIASVYTDGVTEVTDKDGNPPNLANNYLMQPDGSFAGVFYDSPAREESKEFPFKITESSAGTWEILY